jgi:hypothetical protein
MRRKGNKEGEAQKEVTKPFNIWYFNYKFLILQGNNTS